MSSQFEKIGIYRCDVCGRVEERRDAHSGYLPTHWAEVRISNGANRVVMVDVCEACLVKGFQPGSMPPQRDKGGA